MQGKVLRLFITKNDENKTREQKTEVTVDEFGVRDDKFYKKNEQRAVLITSIQSYDMAANKNINLPDGVLGENILIDINPYHLESGKTIQIGNIILEITQNCTLCKGLTAINNKLPKLLKNDRGIFAKVIQNAGTIKVGDSVTISNF